jgi:phenylalanyl-tRNA synthetase beta subunit
MNGRKVGVIAEISDEVLENWELKKPAAAFELNLEKINQELKN